MDNPFSLENKTILITGASSGIGRQCAIDCSKMGARVILVARNVDRLRDTITEMDGDCHTYYEYDLNDIDGIKNLSTSIVAENGKLDGLVHAAGLEVTKPVKLLTSTDYEKLFRVNALAGFELVRHLTSLKNFNNRGG